MTAVFSGLVAAALVSLILTAVSVFFLGKKGPWGSIWTFFLVLFLTLGTVSIYISPVGPVYWDVAWIPITIAGIMMTILLIAAMPHPKQNDTEAAVESKTYTTPAGNLFWLLVILFVIAIMVGMVNPQAAL